ncbi:MAG TPA: C25 family cysteine peptidase [Chloroflexia bacterium]|nr:C25 family cysteine peptidase [Chloroflexia bacterium]
MKATIYRKLTLSMILFMLVSLMPGAMRPGPVSAQGAAAGAQQAGASQSAGINQAPPSEPRTPAYPVKTFPDYKGGVPADAPRMTERSAPVQPKKEEKPKDEKSKDEKSKDEKSKDEQQQVEKEQPQPEQPQPEQPVPQSPGKQPVPPKGNVPLVGEVTLTASAGVPVGTYTTLKEAFDAINAGTHQGTIAISINANTTEAAPAVLNASGSGSALYTSISIQPAGGAPRTISGAIVAGSPLIDLNGADNVTIDGLNTGGNSLTISNTTAGGTTTSTIRFVSDATNNTIQNTTILGSGTGTTSGTIFFSTGTTTGNDGNIITNNNIGPAGTNLPANAIYSLGTSAAVDNSGITISSNNIFDYFSAASVSVGINVSSTGNSAWTINSNRLYQTATRTYTTANTHNGINIGVGSGYTINNNVIGFANSSGTGTTNLAGITTAGTFSGTFPSSYTLGTATLNATRYIAINAAFTAAGTASSIQNNTIAGFALLTSSGASTTNGVFCGIQVLSGNANIGTTTGNTIGTASASIYTASTTAGALIAGIYATTTNTVTIQNNTIQNLDAMGTSASTSGSVNGINLAGTAGNFTVSGNTIGNSTNPNIRMGTLLSGANLSNSGTFGPGTGASVFQGILNAATGTINIGAAALPNTIRNVSANSTSTSARVAGIQTSAGTNTIDSNSIFNLTTPSGNTSTSSSPAAVGIHLSISGLTHTITRNTIRDISSTAASAAVYVDGIYIGSTPATTMSKNLIYNLTTASTSVSSSINGIMLFNSSATENIYNNMMRLGVGVGNNPIIRGIYDDTATSSPTNIIHNSIYIDGTQGSNTVNTACIKKDLASTMTVTDNILWNNRASTGSPGSNAGRHYGIQMLSGVGNPTSNYNDIYAPNNGGTIGRTSGNTDETTLAGWRSATSQDLNSGNSDPKFVDATNATTPDLHINPAVSTFVEGNGTLVVAPTDDFDGQTRSGLTPVDIGADAGNFTAALANDMQAAAFIDPTNGGTKIANVAFSPQASFTNAGTATQTNVPVRYKIIDSGSNVVYNQTATIASIGSQGTTTVTFPSVTLASAGTYTIQAIAELVGDQNTANDMISGTLFIKAPLSGTYTVGVGGAYTTLTAAVSDLNSLGVTGPVIFSLTDATYGSETFPITINAFTGASATNTLAIKPNTGVTAAITGSSASGIIILNGADFVTLDGSNAGTSSRDLTITNTNTGTSSAVIWGQTTAGLDAATNDTIKNINIVGNSTTTTLFGLGFGSATISTTSLGTGNNANTIQNNNLSKSQYGIYTQGASTANKNTGNVITQNLINTASPNNVGIIGILVGFENNIQITQNSVSGMAQAGSPDVFGISLGITAITTSSFTGNEVTNATVARNIIGSVRNTGTFSACGICVAAATSGTNQISNNVLTGVSANGTSGDFTVGILIGGGAGSTTQIYFNSVSMSGTQTGGSDKSYALAIGGSNPTVDIRDNILYNTQNNGSGNNYAVGFGYSTFTNLTSNYNDFFVGTGATYFVGATASLSSPTNQATLANLQAATGKDANSISANPQFISLTNLQPQIGSPVLDAGTSLSGLVTPYVDVTGATRVDPPSMGAYETGADLSGPTITYTPLVNTTSTANRTLNANITDTSGVATGGLSPRIYYKKNAGSYVSTQGVFVSGSTWMFTIDYSLVGGVATGDVISYFVVAQDNLGNISSNPAGASGTDVNNITTFPTTPNSYTIALTYAGPYTVGTGGTYATLKAFFDAVNAGVVVGNITVNIVGDSTETATAVLNQWAEESGSGFTMLIQPSGARTITGNITGALIKLNGADRVTIDGLNTGGNSLTLINNSTTSPSTVVWLSSLGLGQGATNNTIRNTTITGGAVTSGIYGVAILGTTLALNGEDNDNNILDRNLISKVYVGMLASGTAATSSGGLDGLSITGNLIGPAISGATNTGFAGIQVAQALGVNITDNTVRNLTTSASGAGAMNLVSNVDGATIARNTITNITSTSTASGINSISALYLGASVFNATVTRNVITTVASTTTSGYGARAIIVNTGFNGSNITLANNTITDVWNFEDETNPYWPMGIDIEATGGVNLYHNSVNLFGSHTGYSFNTTGGAAAALFVNTTGTGLDIRDNIISNSYDNTTNTVDKAYAVYSLSTAASYSNINYNDYYVSGTGTPVLGFLGSDRATLAAWQTATGQDANSMAVNPLFISNTDLHLQGTSPVLGMGTPIGGITSDVDNDPRPASNPDMGADEVVQAVGGVIPAGTFYNVAAAGGDTLGGNVTVTNRLWLNGILNTGANTLTIDCTATIMGASPSNYIIGNLKKNFCATGAFSFPVGTANGFSQLDANVTALATNPSSLTVTTTQAPQPVLNPAVSLQRYWTLTEGGALTADMTFHYLDGDVAGNEALYRLIRVIGSTAVSFLNNCPTPPPGQACVDTAANTASITGVSEFSDWTLGEPAAPTLARIESVNATRAGDGSGTLVQWKTGYEAANLGFNLYRSEGDKGQRVQVNPSLIAGSAFTAAGAAPAGQSYSWLDASTATANTRYWVEDVDLNGTRTMHGPYATTPGKLVATSNSILLSSLGQTQGASKGVERSAGLPKNDGPASTRPVTGQPAIKLSVKGEGLYRVGQPELLAAGLNANVDPRNLQLYAEGQQIPVRVNGEADGKLDSRDSLEFYGLGLDTPTANTHVYWLVAGQQPGQRISQSQAGGNLTPGGSFPYPVERKDRTVYFSSLLNGDAENFFGPVVSSAGVAQTLTVANLDTAASGQAQLQVTLQGATLQGHSVSVKLNGSNVGTLTFTGRERGTATFSVPYSSLVQGANTVTLTATGAGSDISLVDSVRLTYAHLYRADADALRFAAQGGSLVTIAGFTGQQVRVLDVTNANAPAELIGTVTGSKAEGYSVSLTVPGAGQRTLVALLNTQLSTVSRVAADRPSNWGTSANSADLVIIAHGSLVSSVQPLVTLRESQGYKVVVVDVEDVYDEFSYGAHTPQALRDFLTYASNSWQYKPRYLLLAGDSTFDPKDYLGRGDLDLVPTKLIDTQSMETASDDWLAGYNRDGNAQLAVGRLPVSTVADANAMIAKIVGYAPGSTQQKAVLVADNDSDGYSFEGISHAIANLISRFVQVQEINRSGGTTSEVRQRILDAINAGPMLVNYMGHGNVDTWTGAGLLTSADANALTNGNRLPFFVMMTCLNGYTQDPTFSSLAEALVRAPNGGAIASWASSGMTTPGEQAAMSEELYAAIFSGTPTHDIPLPIAPTLGDAIIRAKATISNPDVRNTWILFGDPTTKLR